MAARRGRSGGSRGAKNSGPVFDALKEHSGRKLSSPKDPLELGEIRLTASSGRKTRYFAASDLEPSGAASAIKVALGRETERTWDVTVSRH